MGDHKIKGVSSLMSGSSHVLGEAKSIDDIIKFHGLGVSWNINVEVEVPSND